MLNPVLCLSNDYNPRLLAIAVLVCVAASFTTFNLLPRAKAEWNGKSAFVWVILTTTTAAAGIWSTHFIAMMAYQPKVDMGFDPVLTGLSLLIAMATVSVSIAIIASTPNRVGATIGGVGLGLSTIMMHYTGVIGMVVGGRIVWTSGPILLSVVVAIVLSVAAVLACAAGTRWQQRLRGGLLFGVSIVTLHFTGMGAVGIVPDPTIVLPANLLSGDLLAYSVGAVTLLIIGAVFAAFIIDFRMRRENENRFKYFARHDLLTKLPNRLYFEELVGNELSHTDDGSRSLALFCLDLDGFKDVNDTFGHGAGDEVLVEVARRLQRLLGDRCVAARLGGDEFAVLATGLGHGKSASAAARGVIDALSVPYAIDGNEVDVGCSIGVAQFPTDGTTYPLLLAHADLALSKAKRDGRGVFRFFDPGMDEALHQRRDLAKDLRGALTAGQLFLVYQSQVDLATQRVTGFEALLRWDHPTRGPVPPSQFIPLAEETGLILPMGEWVLREACREAASWERPLRIAVNMSVAQFRQAGLVATIRDILAKTGLAPERLEIEITESLFFESNSRTAQTLQEVKNLGVRIAMDDFGTGFSSLSTLEAFPFDVIKIDRSFTARLGIYPRATAIVATIIALGRSLDIGIVAEGVETPEQLAMLRFQGCSTLQGHLFGRPRSSAQIREQTQLTPAPGPASNVVPFKAA